MSDGFALPSNAVLDSLKTAKTKAIVFSNPGNPTGAIYTHDDVRRLALWCAQNNVFLIADEVYRRIWFDEPPASALAVDEACLLYTSPSPRDGLLSRMPSSA